MYIFIIFGQLCEDTVAHNIIVLSLLVEWTMHKTKGLGGVVDNLFFKVQIFTYLVFPAMTDTAHTA